MRKATLAPLLSLLSPQLLQQRVCPGDSNLRQLAVRSDRAGHLHQGGQRQGGEEVAAANPAGALNLN